MRLVVASFIPVASAAPLLPDLEIEPEPTRQSIEIADEWFEANSCALTEGCIRGPGFTGGPRRLLKFDTAIRNIGNADLFIGPPETDPLAAESPCHGHIHLDGVATYELLAVKNGQAQTLLISRKQGFCFMDNYPVNPSLANTGKYDCDWQGLSAGWTDIYYSSYECQYLDITDIPPGTYILRTTVNPDFTWKESNTANNVLDVLVEVP